MNELRAVGVFLGSGAGRGEVWVDAARAMGAELARRGLTLVFGGSNAGTMGALADQVLRDGGSVVGVIPAAMVRRGLEHGGLDDLRVVRTMHERKALMYSLSDAIVALPGGIGTLDELFETLAWVQLGIHQKPVGILNVLGYYDPLLAMLRHAEAAGFLPAETWRTFVVATEPAQLLDGLAATRFEHPDKRWTWDV